MNPTQEQYDELAKVFQIGQTRDEAGWENLAIDPDYMDEEDLPAVTADTLDDFLTAAANEWHTAGDRKEIRGGLYWDCVQVRPGDRRVSLAVIDCGDFRLAYQQ